MRAIGQAVRRWLIESFDCFFQAEDGIRDRDVTGVQTCALPISVSARPLAGRLRVVVMLENRSTTPTRVVTRGRRTTERRDDDRDHFLFRVALERSEERRVGKERRDGRLPYY